MSSSNLFQPSSVAIPEPTPEEIAAARQRLAVLDTHVFAAAAPVSPIEQNDLIRRTVRKLFGHGL